MNKDICKRVIMIADYIVFNDATIRETAKVFLISKSTVHKDIKDRLLFLDKEKYYMVKSIMKKHILARHIRGGETTRNLFVKKDVSHCKKM